MKKPILILLLMLFGVAVKAQQTEEDPNQVFTSVEVEPTFGNGIEAFYKYIHTNLQRPKEQPDLKGRVIVQFVVEKDGSLTDVHVLRELAPAFDQEAVRLIKASPKWTPGMQNGRKVRVQYTVPVPFEKAQE